MFDGEANVLDHRSFVVSAVFVFFLKVEQLLDSVVLFTITWHLWVVGQRGPFPSSKSHEKREKFIPIL